MTQKNTVLERMDILRLSNAESNKITKQSLQEALIILLNKKDIESITVSEIVKKAGVSRTAYYRNFSSKEHILESLILDIDSSITKTLRKHRKNGVNYALLKALFEELLTHGHTFRILLKANMGTLIFKNLEIKTRKRFSLFGGNAVYYSSFWAGAFISLITQWFARGCKETPKEMAEIFLSILNSQTKKTK